MANQPIKMDTGNKVLMFISSVALLATVIYLLIQLANFMGGLQLGEPGEAELERIAERIQPIGRVAYGPVDVEEEAADLSPGDIYSNVCAACHDTGASDAPLKDDSDAWAAVSTSAAWTRCSTMPSAAWARCPRAVAMPA